VYAYIVAGKVVDVGLGQHGVVWRESAPALVWIWITVERTLELTLAERWGVAGNYDQLGLARSEGLEG
jgi:hypothetical protein